MVILGRLLVLFAVVLSSGGISAQEPDTTFWVPNGPVHKIVIHDTTIILGGSFDLVSPVTGAFVRMDTTVPNVDASFPKVFGTVYATASDRLGYVYVGGSFTRVANQSVGNLFRLKPDGTFDHSFVHTVIGTVYCLEVNDTALYIGGEFTHINAEERNNFGAINLITGATHDCNPNVNGPVYSMVPDYTGNTMVIGGDFSHVDNYAHPFVAKIEMSFGAVGSWNAIPNVNGPVFDLHIESVWLYLAGDFTHFAVYPRRGLGKVLLSNGSLWQSADAQLDGPVYTMLFTDSTIYIGGKFTSAGGETRNNIAALDDNLILRQWWDLNANGEVRVIFPLDKTRLFVGGNFTRIANDTAGHGAIINKATLLTRNWDPQFNQNVYTAICDTSQRLYIGGDFYGAGSCHRKNLCAISLNSGRVTDWTCDVDSTVYTMTLDGDSLYLGGYFTTIDGTPRSHIGAIDLQTLTLLPFNPVADGVVRTITITDSLVYAGGNFTLIGGQPRNNIAKLDKFSGQSSTWDPDCFGTVNSILVTSQWIYVAGFYSNIGGTPRQNVARLFPQSGLADLSWVCDTDDGVYHAEMHNNQLAIAGWFSSVNAQSAAQFALVDTSTSAQLAQLSFSTDGFVRTFTQFGDDFFIGGMFDLAGNTYRPQLVAFDVGDNAVDPWSPFPNSMPLTLHTTGTRLFVGGTATLTAGRFHPYFQVLPIQWVTSTTDHIPPQSRLTVSPNPTSDYVVVKGLEEHSVYTLTDVAGNVLQSGNLLGSTVQLSLTDYSSGMYFLNVTNAEQISSQLRIIRY